MVVCYALLSCQERGASPEAQQGREQSRVLPPTLPIFLRGDARLIVAHSGIRHFEFPEVASPSGDYRERITTDGRGGYALEPIDSGAFDPSEWEFFELQQRAHEGFLFRYRDFQVRDAELFARNWETTPLDPATFVIGRRCSRYRLERLVGESSFWEVSVDDETGLVLASQEFGVDGRLLAAMSYESVELQPALGGVVWHVERNEEVALDVNAPVVQDGSTLLSPRVLPSGYALFEVATVGNGQGARWLKRTYSDGLAPLFFMQALTRIGTGPSAQTMAGAGPEASSIAVFELGSVRVAQGRVNGFDLIAIGRVVEAELLDLIDSALP
jgi:hypothetical protein